MNKVRKMASVVLVLCVVLSGCDASDVYGLGVARAGRKCSGAGFARDSKNVLQCKRGKWAVVMPISRAIALIDAYNASQSSTTTTPRTTALPTTAVPTTAASTANPATTTTTTTPPPTPTPAPNPNRGPRLSATQWLAPGQYLQSADERYKLQMQPDGNLVLSTPGYAIWSTATAGNPGAKAIMQPDGNFVVYRANGTALWSTRTSAANATIGVQPDGNIVVRNSADAALWSSGTYSDQLFGPDFLKIGQYLKSADGRYQLLLQPDSNLVLYGPTGARWSAASVNSGAVRLTLQSSDGNAVLYRANGTPVWDAGAAGAGSRFVVQSDGNLVHYRANGSVVWQSGTSETVPPSALGSRIADYAETFPNGYAGGQCRGFVNNVMAHFGFATGGGAPNDYFVGFERHNPTRITDGNSLARGDVVQYRKSEYSAGLHTFIILSRVSGTTYNVIDSNYALNERVSRHTIPVTLDEDHRAYRFN